MHNIPEHPLRRVVVVGGGFAGLKIARSLSRKHFQVVLLDKLNHHQFQPLLYQVATSGLEPSSISFPFRKAFHKEKFTHFRMAEVLEILPSEKKVRTDIGELSYDHLVIAVGADTNYFGQANIQRHAMPMKTVGEALAIRNGLIERMEMALNASDPETRSSLLNVVIVGGGPTGVELAGAIAEMKKYVLPKDYPEMDFGQMEIHLFEGGKRVLEALSETSSQKANRYLEDLGVHVHLEARVVDYDGSTVSLSDGSVFPAKLMLWAAGIKANRLGGLPESAYGRGGRLLVDAHNRLLGHEDIYAVGDVALMTEKNWPNGHPQVAQVAIQQAALLCKNLLALAENRPEKIRPFAYKDLGSMATVGRNKAVVDLPKGHLGGFFAWAVWLFVHLMNILGVKNKFFIFINWMVSYLTYDQSLRLIIRPKDKDGA